MEIHCLKVYLGEKILRGWKNFHRLWETVENHFHRIKIWKKNTVGQYKGIYLILYRIVENIPTMEVSSIKLYIVKYLIDFLDSVLYG